MTCAIIQATAKRLAELWPDKKIWLDKVPAGFDNGFFIQIVSRQTTPGLHNTQRFSASVDILYYSSREDTLGYHHWAEEMFENFTCLTALGTRFYPSGRKAVQAGREYHFLFDLSASLKLKTSSGGGGEPMETLVQTGKEPPHE